MTNNIPVISSRTAELLINSHAIGLRPGWSVLKASGPTIRDYLQGQISQDIRKLSQEQAIHTMLLQPQGKAAGELYIVEGNHGELVMLAPAEVAEETVARLRRFALGHQVRIGIVDTLAVCSVQGANAAEALKAFGLPEPGNGWLACSRSDGDCFALTWPADPHGFWVVAARDRIETLLSTSMHVVGEDQLEAMRIIRGMIRFGQEWDASVSPMNANMVEFDAVSFNKGCYVGQEITSRMHWRGGVKKRLYRVLLEQAPASLPSAILTEAAIGTLVSAAIDHEGRCFGIAQLPIETVESGKAMRLADGQPIGVLEPCHA